MEDDNVEVVFNYIIEFRAMYHMSPTIREIRDGCDIKSPSTVYRVLRVLEEEGRIEYPPLGERSYRHARGYYVPDS